MPKLVEPTSSAIANQSQLRQEAIRKAILSFFKDLEAAAESAVCLTCGSASELRKITVSMLLAKEGQVWEMSLPVCESCIRQDGITSRLQKTFTPPGQNQGQVQGEKPPERAPSTAYTSTAAVLASQMEAIHTANVQYWKRGAAASPEERSEYQGRQERLEEIRALTESSSRRAGRRTTGRGLPKAKRWLQ